MEWGDVGDSLSRASALTPLPASPQPVTVTCTPGAAASTPSCTSCRGARAGASASTVATTPPAATATTARRATTATWASPSPTGRPAKVGRAPGPREHSPLPLLFRFLVPGTDLPGKRAGHLHACAHARARTRTRTDACAHGPPAFGGGSQNKGAMEKWLRGEERRWDPGEGAGPAPARLLLRLHRCAAYHRPGVKFARLTGGGTKGPLLPKPRGPIPLDVCAPPFPPAPRPPGPRPDTHGHRRGEVGPLQGQGLRRNI